MPYTTQEIAEKLGVERQTAYGLVLFLEKMKLIDITGERKRPDGKGKPAREYSFPADCATKLQALLAKLA